MPVEAGAVVRPRSWPSSGAPGRTGGEEKARGPGPRHILGRTGLAGKGAGSTWFTNLP